MRIMRRVKLALVHVKLTCYQVLALFDGSVRIVKYSSIVDSNLVSLLGIAIEQTRRIELANILRLHSRRVCADEWFDTSREEDSIDQHSSPNAYDDLTNQRGQERKRMKWMITLTGWMSDGWMLGVFVILFGVRKRGKGKYVPNKCVQVIVE